MASFHSNTALFLSLLVAVFAFMAAPSSVEAQIPSNILPRVLSISGIVNCVASVNVSANGTNLPPFPNATVMLRCGNTTAATTNTNLSGIFGIVSNALPVIAPVYQSLFGGSKCQLMVKEPLSTCNATLPSTGNLVSQLSEDNLISFLDGVMKFTSTPFVQLALPPGLQLG